MVQKKVKNNNFLILIFSALLFTSGFIVRGFFGQTVLPSLPSQSCQSQKVIALGKPKNIALPDMEEGEYRVARVLDGDTVELETGERFRLLGIDAPEPDDRWGLQAKDYLKSMIGNKKVRVELDREKIDCYGRLLGYLWLGETLVNEKLLEEGYAVVYLEQGGLKLKYIDRFEAAQTWAKDHHNGLWLDVWK